MSILNSTPLLMGDEGGYQISRSVRLRRSASAYLNRTPASTGNRKTWTWSGWVKRSEFSATAGIQVLFDSRTGTSDNTILGLAFGNGTYGTSADGLFVGQYNYFALVTTQVFRDPSAWYHIVLALDTTQATAANRMKLYVNGLQITAFNTTTYPALNADLGVNLNQLHTLGSQSGSSNFNDCYLTDINFIDGQGLTPSSFGEFNALTGVWTAKKYSGSYGTNGFSVNFSDNSAATAAAIGKDSSGNGNNWTPNNISVTAGVTYDSMIDTPTPYADGGNGRGNYCVFNPLDLGGGQTTTNGNLTVNYTSGSWTYGRASFWVSSNKWYWEVTITAITNGGLALGIGNQSSLKTGSGNNDANFWFYNALTGVLNSNTTNPTSVVSSTTNDIVGFAFDVGGATLALYKNNSLLYTFTGITGSLFTAITGQSTSIGGSCAFNFGQRPFTYTPPSGFKALNTQNLPDSTIENGATQFNINLSAATSATRTVTGFAFAPDLVVAKNRSYVDRWGWGDSVRGANKTLASNLTNAEVATTDTIMSFNSDGFTLGADATAYGWNYNRSGNSQYAYWAWKAGGAAVTNTAGSISSQVSANVSAGFSVVTYTGTGANATVGHGLGVAPKFIIVKSRSVAGSNWPCYHVSTGNLGYNYLNLTLAVINNAAYWNSTSPTSSVFSLGIDGANNQSSATFVAYCFAEVAGYSKFGSYVGNGSADGPFVYLGFLPRYIMVKSSSIGGAGYDWFIQDTARNSVNSGSVNHLWADSIVEENNGSISTAANNVIDVLSNGFKCRYAPGGATNSSGVTYIYMAFAENPFKNALAR